MATPIVGSQVIPGRQTQVGLGVGQGIGLIFGFIQFKEMQRQFQENIQLQRQQITESNEQAARQYKLNAAQLKVNQDLANVEQGKLTEKQRQFDMGVMKDAVKMVVDIAGPQVKGGQMAVLEMFQEPLVKMLSMGPGINETEVKAGLKGFFENKDLNPMQKLDAIWAGYLQQDPAAFEEAIRTMGTTPQPQPQVQAPPVEPLPQSVAEVYDEPYTSDPSLPKRYQDVNKKVMEKVGNEDKSVAERVKVVKQLKSPEGWVPKVEYWENVGRSPEDSARFFAMMGGGDPRKGVQIVRDTIMSSPTRVAEIGAEAQKEIATIKFKALEDKVKGLTDNVYRLLNLNRLIDKDAHEKTMDYVDLKLEEEKEKQRIVESKRDAGIEIASKLAKLTSDARGDFFKAAAAYKKDISTRKGFLEFIGGEGSSQWASLSAALEAETKIPAEVLTFTISRKPDAYDWLYSTSGGVGKAILGKPKPMTSEFEILGHPSMREMVPQGVLGVQEELAPVTTPATTGEGNPPVYTPPLEGDERKNKVKNKYGID